MCNAREAATKAAGIKHSTYLFTAGVAADVSINTNLIIKPACDNTK